MFYVCTKVRRVGTKKKLGGFVWNLKDVNKLTYFNNIYLVNCNIYNNFAL